MRDYLSPEAGRAEGAAIGVSELNAVIAGIIASVPELSGITVTGEVSDLRRYGSGHWYFSLKDEKSQIKAVMWKMSAARQMASGFIPEDGMLVLATGDVNVYEAGGIYQLNVKGMRPAGEGAKYAAFLKLKQKLMDEGIIDPNRRRRLPSFVSTIALITSPSSAAARDFQKVARERWKGIGITLIPAVMQGATAPASVMSALRLAGSLEDADAIAIVRGGGSAEDLWCFNDEALARAIAASPKPVVTGIGHETDVTIADMVADLRASTPSNAAELLVPDEAAATSKLAELSRRIGLMMESRVNTLRSRLEAMVSASPIARPMDMVDIRRQAIDEGGYALLRAMERRINEAQLAFRMKSAALSALNPEAVLERGFSICMLPDGSVVRDSSQAKAGDDLKIRLHAGGIGCRVTSTSSKL